MRDYFIEYDDSLIFRCGGNWLTQCKLLIEVHEKEATSYAKCSQVPGNQPMSSRRSKPTGIQ